MPANYTYTRIRPLDLLQVANDQGGNITLSAAIAAIQANGNQTKNCPQCKDNNGNPTGWITIPVNNGNTKVICTICDGFLKTVQQYMPDPNNTGKFIILLINGGNSVKTNNTLNLTSNVPGGSWASSDQTKATIDQNTGIATGLAIGTTIITYTTGIYSTSIVLNVTQ